MARSKVSHFNSFVESFSDQPVYIGIDVHKNSYHIGMVRLDGPAVDSVCPANPADVLHLVGRLNAPLGAVAYEAGPTGFGLARFLEAAGHRVIVVAPSRVPRPVAAGAKTDRLDCLKLAEYASRGLLRPIAVPTEEDESNRSLNRRRCQLADAIRKSKQRIRSLLLEFGAPEPPGLSCWGKRAVAELAQTPLPDGARLTLESHLRELQGLRTEQELVLRNLAALQPREELAEKMRCLQSAPGVGPKVASAFCLEVFNPERFQRAEELTSYIGLAPVVSHSGEGKAQCRLHPAGQTALRSMLIQSAWVFIRHDEAAKALYRRLVARHGLAQKAIVAVARKLAILLWRLLVERRTFEPRPLAGTS
jgi:transposase